jgi:copper oxidase (laccase) domain-containing protein
MTTTNSTSRRSSSKRRGVEVRCSTRADGDFHLTRQPYAELERRRRSFVDLPWTMTDQRHGTAVVRVATPGAGDGAVGDIAITDSDDAVLGCWAADCAPLVLIGSHRTFAIVHAGWRGLATGVVDAAVDAFDEPIVEVLLGPTIGPCCYEFGADDLAAVAAGVHTDTASILASTSTGAPALDVPAAVRAAAARHGVTVTKIAGCTGCDHDGYSHRARREPQRHVVAAWRPSRRDVA